MERGDEKGEERRKGEWGVPSAPWTAPVMLVLGKKWGETYPEDLALPSPLSAKPTWALLTPPSRITVITVFIDREGCLR